MPQEVVSPNLPWNHWAVRAAERVDALGLVTDWLPAQREVPIASVEAALAEAEQRAPARVPELAPLTAAWVRKFRAEWSGVTEPVEELRLLGGAASAGYAAQDRGGTVSGRRTPAALLVPTPSAQGRFTLLAAAAAGPHLAALAAPRLEGTDLQLARGELVAGIGPIRLSLGRSAIRYGHAESGAVVYSGNAPLDRLELSTARPVRLPWVLSGLGLVSAEAFLAWLNEPRHPYHPFLAGFSLQLRPHPRLVLAVQRGVMFGGARWTGRDMGDVLGAALGTRNGSENNIAAFAVRYRAPTENWLPATLHVEWGGDDNGGAWLQVPGLVMGISIPALPRLPEISVGGEFSYLGRLFRRDITWYSHGYYTGGWATGHTPLGHQLGGNGREYRAHVTADLLDAKLRLRGAVFARQRFSGNLYASNWIGSSRGVDLEASFELWPVEFELLGCYEGSSEWSTSGAKVTARVYY